MTSVCVQVFLSGAALASEAAYLSRTAIVVVVVIIVVLESARPPPLLRSKNATRIYHRTHARTHTLIH